jgi:hypothetical protein
MNDRVREISIAVYKLRLEQSSEGAVDRMLAKDCDEGQKLSNRASSYDPLTRAYMKVLGVE